MGYGANVCQAGSRSIHSIAMNPYYSRHEGTCVDGAMLEQWMSMVVDNRCSLGGAQERLLRVGLILRHVNDTRNKSDGILLGVLLRCP
jgi:hypothetical protein